MPIRGRLFHKYALYFASVVVIGVLASGLIGLGFSYRDTRVLVDELHREKARSAAATIDQYLRTIESHLRAALLALPVAPADTALDEQHQELIKLLRINSAVVEAAWIDAGGIERLRLSRIAPDVLGGSRNRSDDAVVTAARMRKTGFGTVYFRDQTEPYLSIAVAGDAPAAGVVVAEINLKFVWDVVSKIRVGDSGYAYVVDAAGRLVSHPDISLVLRLTDLSALSQVKALAPGGDPGAGRALIADTAADGRARRSLVAWMPVASVGWFVLVEQPVLEAFAPLYATLARTALILIACLAVGIAMSVALARRMTAPIRALQAGAARIGNGELDQEVTIRTGDELETLAHAFNTMAHRLHEARTGLEQKIEDRTQALAAANQAKSRFLAVASHDLRQPVHALGLFVVQARQAQDDTVRSALIDRIESSWQSISELLDALLDISKLDSSTLEASRVVFPAQAMLDRVDQGFAALAHARGLRLRVRPSKLLLASDPLLLERILINLVSNAVRYTRDGGLLVGVRRRGGLARIDVWDTGIGIPQDEAVRIFDEFYRGPGIGIGDGQAQVGLGLGLAIVRRLAQALGTSVTVRSVPGRGSVFSLQVPLAPDGAAPDAPAGPQQAPPAEIAQSGFVGGLALIVDDDADARDAAAGLLAQWGWEALCAGSGPEALQALATLGHDDRRPDVIVSDFHLGAENGIEVIASIRRACGSELPAVLVSGDVTQELRARAAGESLHLLHKPLQAAKLRAILQHLRGAQPPG